MGDIRQQIRESLASAEPNRPIGSLSSRISAERRASRSESRMSYSRTHQSEQNAQTTLNVTMQEPAAPAPQPVKPRAPQPTPAPRPAPPAAVKEDSYEATARRMREAMVRYQSDVEDTKESRYEDASHSQLAQHGQLWYPGTDAM